MAGRRRGKAGAPRPIAGAVDRTIDAAAPGGRRLLRIIERWKQIVSAETLHHARPTSIRRDLLYVTTTDPLWKSELTYFVPGLLAKINEILGPEERMTDIRLRVGTLPDSERWARSEQSEEEPDPDLSGLGDAVRSRLERIEDPELRMSLARIASRLGGSGPS